MALHNPPPDPALADFPAVGELVPRFEFWTNSLTPVTGALYLSFFTAARTETITTLTTCTIAAAAATPTLCRMGVYSVAANGDLTLEAATPNDTALWSVANAVCPKALSVPFVKVKGVRYATGVLCVSAAALQTLSGHALSNTTPVGTVMLAAPTRVARLVGQTDLPGSITAGSLAANLIRPGVVLS